LKIDALQLRGFYLVAQAMATTYVDISAHYIIPGVKQVDLLGIASEEEVPESMFQSKIESLERYSQEAQSKINNIAQQVSIIPSQHHGVVLLTTISAS
jgi:hypothetical protein